MRITKGHTTVVVLTALIAAGVTQAGAVASPALSASASRLPGTAQLKAAPAVLITTRTVVPKPQRTVRFTGYATYTFTAPKGRRIVSASARILGAQAHAVAIRHRAISRNRRRYTVSLIFPGEQGNPGKLVVRLLTAG